MQLDKMLLHFQPLQLDHNKQFFVTMLLTNNEQRIRATSHIQRPIRTTRSLSSGAWRPIQMSTTCDNYKFSFFPRTIVDWTAFFIYLSKMLYAMLSIGVKVKVQQFNRKMENQLEAVTVGFTANQMKTADRNQQNKTK